MVKKIHRPTYKFVYAISSIHVFHSEFLSISTHPKHWNHARCTFGRADGGREHEELGLADVGAWSFLKTASVRLQKLLPIFFKWDCISHNYLALLFGKKTWHINIEIAAATLFGEDSKTFLAQLMRKTCRWFVSNAGRMSIQVNTFCELFSMLCLKTVQFCPLSLWGPAKHPQSTFACVLLIARDKE